jgi:7,8-dihydro-6-hydroxymethylpterin-pyrophosphokinase
MAARNFVLRPLLELAPGWRHPVTGVAIEKLIINNSISDIYELID